MRRTLARGRGANGRDSGAPKGGRGHTDGVQTALQLAALCAFAFAQPLYDLLGQHPTYFVARGAQPIDLALFVLGLSFAVPALVVAPVLLVQWLAPRAGAALAFVVEALLAACIALPLVNELTDLPGVGGLPGSGGALACGVALALGTGFAFGRFINFPVAVLRGLRFD